MMLQQSCDKTWESFEFYGRGGGLMVSVLAFYSDDTSSNPSEVFHFAVKLLVRRTNKQKDAGVSPL